MQNPNCRGALKHNLVNFCKFDNLVFFPVDVISCQNKQFYILNTLGINAFLMSTKYSFTKLNSQNAILHCSKLMFTAFSQFNLY